MKNGFRQSQAWLHTWTGLLAGWLLYFMFVTGTLGYFYVELDRWMRPELPLASNQLTPAQYLDKAEAFLRRSAPDADLWLIDLPTGRRASQPSLGWATPHSPLQRLTFDASTDTFVPLPTVRETGGGYLLYRMHWQLHYLPQHWAILLVSACTMVLWIALITGVITHKKIFADFFKFRPGRGQRSWLDFHNVTGVMTLPFCLMITFSGLAFFMADFMPAAVHALYAGDRQAFEADLFPRLEPKPRAHEAAPVLPLKHFIAEAERRWGTGEVASLHVTMPGDRHGQVQLFHAGSRTVLRDVNETLYFDASAGDLLRQITVEDQPAREVLSALFGLHEGIFAGVSLRWLYFLSGLLGCLMIASGLVLWTIKRRDKHVENDRRTPGFALVETLNIGTVAGLPVAIAAFFWANRLLPIGLPERAAWEANVMFLAWAAMLIYPAFRPPRRAWIEELSLAAAGCLLLPLVNALTTHRHLAVTIPAGDWELAGVDLTALIFGLLLGLTAVQLHRRAGS